MRKIFFISMFLLALLSCSDNDTSGVHKEYKVIKATIKDAEYIYGTSPTSLNNRFSSSSNFRANTDRISSNDGFWTVDKNGKSNPIQFLTENGDIIDMKITNVFDINQRYLILEGEFELKIVEVGKDEDPWNFPMIPYILVDKQTEDIYEFPFYSFSPQFYTDKHNHIYFMSHSDDMVYKMNMSNPNDISVEEYLPKSQKVRSFIVNQDGLLVINPESEGKFKTPGGRIYPIQELINADNMDVKSVFLGFDDSYYIAYSDNENRLTVNKVLGSNELSSEYITKTEVPFSTNKFIPNHIKKAHIAVGFDQSFIEFNEVSREMKEWNIQLSIIDLYANNDYITSESLYIKDQSQSNLSLVKLNFSDYSTSKIDFMKKGYEAYSISTSINSPDLSFTGLRFSDGKNIIGTVDSKDQITALEDINLKSKTTTLIKLN